MHGEQRAHIGCGVREWTVWSQSGGASQQELNNRV